MRNPESQFSNIDKLVAEVEGSLDAKKVLVDIDSMCAEIDQGLEDKKREIAGWSLEKRHKEAANGADPFVLNLLSMDENFNVRTLTFCNPNTPENSMRRALKEVQEDYVRMVIANNPNTPSDILDRLAELTSEPEVLNAVKLHPNVSEVTKYKIENRMT
jgi:hypothetical protein